MRLSCLALALPLGLACAIGLSLAELDLAPLHRMVAQPPISLRLGRTISLRILIVSISRRTERVQTKSAMEPWRKGALQSIPPPEELSAA